MLSNIETYEHGYLDSSLTNELAINISTTASVIVAYVEALMCEPADELVSKNNIRCEHNYLKDIPNKVHLCIHDFIHEHDREFIIDRDKAEIITCNITDDVPDHKCLTHEMVICNS